MLLLSVEAGLYQLDYQLMWEKQHYFSPVVLAKQCAQHIIIYVNPFQVIIKLADS